MQIHTEVNNVHLELHSVRLQGLHLTEIAGQANLDPQKLGTLIILCEYFALLNTGQSAGPACTVVSMGIQGGQAGCFRKQSSVIGTRQGKICS